MLGFSALGAASIGALLVPAVVQIPEQPEVPIDATKIPASRKVVFGGGIRTVVFAGGTRTVVFSGGTRTVRF